MKKSNMIFCLLDSKNEIGIHYKKWTGSNQSCSPNLVCNFKILTLRMVCLKAQMIESKTSLNWVLGMVRKELKQYRLTACNSKKKLVRCSGNSSKSCKNKLKTFKWHQIKLKHIDFLLFGQNLSRTGVKVQRVQFF